jgi:BirA family transcriptional regulator, biotin operon repressor / biotin---[acetyl-CoA-carboxylase] ligase
MPLEESNLSPDLILQGLKTRFIGQKVIYYARIASTMDAARQEARWGAPAGTVIVAEEQTEARGRLRRSWISPPGSLSVSVILRPNIEYLPKMIMLASLAVVRCIQDVAGLKASIKWPNDVRLYQKKVCGILIENDIRFNHLLSSIIGIGINVNMDMDAFPEISGIATSLADETGKIISRLDVAQQLFVEMERLYLILPQGDRLFQEWRDNLEMLGEQVQVNCGNDVIVGIADSVTPDGALVLHMDDDTFQTVLAGDVSLKGPLL